MLTAVVITIVVLTVVGIAVTTGIHPGDVRHVPQTVEPLPVHVARALLHRRYSNRVACPCKRSGLCHLPVTAGILCRDRADGADTGFGIKMPAHFARQAQLRSSRWYPL